MIRNHLKLLVLKAIDQAQASGDLPAFEVPPFILDHPRQSEMGDYAVSVAMQLARVARMPPPRIAQTIAKHLAALTTQAAPETAPQTAPDQEPTFEIEVVNAFINLRLSPEFLATQVEPIVKAGPQWGNVDIGHGQKAQVEHGSANPTGYATIGTARNVTVGDTLANTLDAAGYQTQREWYINDAGSQIRVFGASVFARYAQALGQEEPMPEKGYQSDDVIEVAQRIKERNGDKYLRLPREDAVRVVGQLGVDLIMERIRQTMARLGIRYDNFFSEHSLYTSGLANKMLEELSQKGLLIEHEGAQWFSEDGSAIRAGQGRKKTSADYAAAGAAAADPTHRLVEELDETDDELEGDEIEVEPTEKGKRLPIQAVVIRSARVIANPAERATYLASDIPYAYNKVIERGFNPAVYVWGEDHQADVERVKAAAKAIGVPDDAIKILIYRFITLLRDGQEVRMGKRKGNAILTDDVLDEIGSDALRYIMLSRSIDTKFSFDIGVLKEQNDTNPLYYVQYGHARICSIERKAEEEHWPINPNPPMVFTEPSALALIRKLLELPEVVELVATHLQPHHYTTYAREVAQAFSRFYDECRIKDSPPDVAGARLKLARAARFTLAKVLSLMGMSAPERMHRAEAVADPA